MAYRATAYTEQRRADARERVLSATVTLLREGGYRAAQIDDIAARAGLAAGSVYRHFETKAALLAEVFRLLSGREVEAMERALAGAGPVLPRLDTAVAGFARRALKGRAVAYALIAEPVDVAVDAERLVYRRAYARALERAVAEGVRTGELPRQDPALTAAALVGALAEALLGSLSVPSRGQDEPIISGVVTFCRRAVGGEAPPSRRARTTRSRS